MGTCNSNCLEFCADVENRNEQLEAIIKPLIQQEIKGILPEIEKLINDSFKLQYQKL